MNQMTLGKIIRNRRIELNISQRSLANRLVGTERKYCSPQLLHNIEHDIRTGKQYWQSLSKELDLPIEVFTYYGLLAKSGLYPSVEIPIEIVQSLIQNMHNSITAYLHYESV